MPEHEQEEDLSSTEESSTEDILYDMHVRADEAARGIDVRRNERAIRWGFEVLWHRGAFREKRR